MDRFYFELKGWHKTSIVMMHDSVVILATFYLGLASRLGFLSPKMIFSNEFLQVTTLVCLVQFATLYLTGLYRGIWRYSSVVDLFRVIKGAGLAVLISYMAVFLFTRLDLIPRSLIFINFAYLVMGLGGGRLLYRILRDYYVNGSHSQGERTTVLIVGAGAGGEQLFREIKKNPSMCLTVVGFVDDSPYLKRKMLHGLPILGATEDLPVLITTYKIKTVFIAIPSATSNEIRRIFNLIKDLKLEIKVLPKISKILYEHISLQSLKNLKIEDLLGREEVKLDLTSLEKMLTNKRVLVTGAGGSIGSELCEQLAKFKPEILIAVDHSEFNTYTLDQGLRSRHPDLIYEAIVGDVRDIDSMRTLFERVNPDVVLHAAAYKHVPLMEFNPFESIRTNVLGTKNIAELSVEFKVKRFVLISTDKAVNPTNVMGCTKRIAEMVIQQIQQNSPDTKMMTVRFGNVLGSSGSVIPLFRKQIEMGGPLTVTHPEITRYFMSIPEATKLVLQAGAMGSGGELFVLDMGQPVKIIDLAREMITLAGLHEEVDIKIQITGLRPGEKLYEEPLMENEKLLSTPHPMVKVCEARPLKTNFSYDVSRLVNLDTSVSRQGFLDVLKSLVEEYKAHRELANEQDDHEQGQVLSISKIH